jgi:hypothetical protein
VLKWIEMLGAYLPVLIFSAMLPPVDAVVFSEGVGLADVLEKLLLSMFSLRLNSGVDAKSPLSGQHINIWQVGLTGHDKHWPARDDGGLVAAMLGWQPCPMHVLLT